jgi:LPS sulfotransferase NodH
VGLPSWTAADVRDHLQRVTALRTTPNGVFGVKAHFEQLATLLLARGLTPEDIWPDVRAVWLVRRDTVRQAVSFARARQTAAWTGAARDARPAVYRREDVAAALRDIERWERDWSAWFAARPSPLRLDYEDVAADLPGALAAVFQHLDLEPPDRWPAPALRVQADEDSDAWCAAFRDGR